MVRILSILFCIVFICFAVLQLNDPDPIFWFAIYLTVAAVSFLSIINKQNKRIVLGVLLMIAVISLFYLPGFIEWLSLPDKAEIFGEMVYKKPYIEETREFIGLMMALGTLVFHYKKT